MRKLTERCFVDSHFPGWNEWGGGHKTTMRRINYTRNFFPNPNEILSLNLISPGVAKRQSLLGVCETSIDVYRLYTMLQMPIEGD